MLDSVFFELEGVLADTAEVRRDALLSTLRADGVHLSDPEYLDLCAGQSFEQAIRAARQHRQMTVDETAVALAAARAERAYRAFIGKGITLVDGAREAVERLHSVARLALVTRASRAEAALVLSLARIEHAFTCVVAEEDTRVGKPSPDPYLFALTRLERQQPARPKGTMVALEDGLAGIRSAREAGLSVVVVGDVPAHVALEADGCIRAITGVTADQLMALVAQTNERTR